MNLKTGVMVAENSALNQMIKFKILQFYCILLSIRDF